jgi:hypothetical protein
MTIAPGDAKGDLLPLQPYDETIRRGMALTPARRRTSSQTITLAPRLGNWNSNPSALPNQRPRRSTACLGERISTPIFFITDSG